MTDARPSDARTQLWTLLDLAHQPAIQLGELSIVLVIALYWFVATRPGVNPALVPSPPRIALTFWQELRSGDLVTNTLASLQRVLIGFAFGTGLAVLLGCLAGWFRFWVYFLNPLIDAIRPIPALAYIPLVIVWVGIEASGRRGRAYLGRMVRAGA